MEGWGFTVTDQTHQDIYLERKEAEKVDKIVEEGLKEHRRGETEEVESFSDLE